MRRPKTKPKISMPVCCCLEGMRGSVEIQQGILILSLQNWGHHSTKDKGTLVLKLNLRLLAPGWRKVGLEPLQHENEDTPVNEEPRQLSGSPSSQTAFKSYVTIWSKLYKSPLVKNNEKETLLWVLLAQKRVSSIKILVIRKSFIFPF